MSRSDVCKGNKPFQCVVLAFNIKTGDLVNRERGKHRASWQAERPGTALVNTNETGSASAAHRQRPEVWLFFSLSLSGVAISHKMV